MSADWVAVSIVPGERRDAVLAALFAAGSQAVHEDGDRLRGFIPADLPIAGLVGAILEASPGTQLQIEPAPRIDWTEEWKRSIHAQELGALVVTPPWLAHLYDPSRCVVIDPGMAFGTGEHETTRGVIRLLPSVLRPGDRVADLGAGSGVLSIAAAKLGARSVVGIEIDSDAIANAESNVTRNAVADRVSILEGDAEWLLPLVAPVRLVTANIISSVLVELLPVISAVLPQYGEAILGGILWDERPAMLEVLEAGDGRGDGWRVTAEDHEGIWWTTAIARR